MSSWDAQLRDVKKEIAKLEDRISALKRELQTAQSAADAGRVQGILAVRERHLERATLHARFIESRTAQGNRAAKHIPYAALASICISAAERTAQADTAEALKALGKNFSAKAIADASYALGCAQALQDRLGHHGKSGAGSDASDHRLVRGKFQDPFGHHIA